MICRYIRSGLCSRAKAFPLSRCCLPLDNLGGLGTREKFKYIKSTACTACPHTRSAVPSSKKRRKPESKVSAEIFLQGPVFTKLRTQGFRAEIGWWNRAPGTPPSCWPRRRRASPPSAWWRMRSRTCSRCARCACLPCLLTCEKGPTLQLAPAN
jgi:hypothetical protein